jgi:hypothetical protein
MCPFGYWFGLICVDYTGAQMALRKLFLVYVLSTAAAIAAPFVMTWVEGVRRHAIPVNSEMALEPTPAINTPYSDSLGRNTRPACIAPDGIEYFGDVSFAMRGKQGALRLLGNVLANDFYSCAAAPYSYWEGAGRYVCFPRASGLGVWIGTEFTLWKEQGSTPLWLAFEDNEWQRGSEVRVVLEPWASRNGISSVWRRNGDGKDEFAIGIVLETGQEEEAVIASVSQQLENISEALSLASRWPRPS